MQPEAAHSAALAGAGAQKHSKKDAAKDSTKSDRISTIPNLIRDPSGRRYLPTSKIGSGGFASVWRAKVVDQRGSTSSSSPECALKVVRSHIKSSQIRQRFRFEMAIHNKLRHPNIVRFHRAFAADDLTYVALELCEHGSLTDVVKCRKALTMPEIRRYVIQLTGAVAYLHSRGVVHRDIKAGNVFLDARMDVKLGDFGLATCLEPDAQEMGAFQRRTTFCGTPNYLAPELLSRRGHAEGVDIWAIGILIYYLAVGAPPFQSKSKEEIYERVKRQDYAWPAPPRRPSRALQELVSLILVEEDRRPSLRGIVQHDFFANGYVPHRIDALARTRAPRWKQSAGEATVSTAEDDPSLAQDAPAGFVSAYDELIRQSFQMGEPAEESVLLTAQREFEEGRGPEVPLPLDAVVEPYVSRLARVAGAPPKRGKKARAEAAARQAAQIAVHPDPEPEPVQRIESLQRPESVQRLDAPAQKLDYSHGSASTTPPLPEPTEKKTIRILGAGDGNAARASSRRTVKLTTMSQPENSMEPPSEETRPLSARPRTLRSASARQRLEWQRRQQAASN